LSTVTGRLVQNPILCFKPADPFVAIGFILSAFA
jgi:hypothetical protein